MTHRFPSAAPLAGACLLVAAMTLPALRSQGPLHPTAYPNDTLSGGWGNCSPLGQNTSGSCDETRSHLLIPAAYLPPSGGSIRAIEVAAPTWAATSTTLNYASLDISMDHRSLPALDINFANNLTAPTLVFSRQSWSQTYPQGAWTRLTLDTPYPYNGIDHLVLEFVKTMTNAAAAEIFHTNSRDERLDLPRMMVAIGQLGSGSSTAPSITGAGRPIRIRVLFENTPTQTVMSDRGGAINNYYALGQAVTVTTHAGVGSLFLNFLLPSGQGLLRSPVVFPGIQGESWIGLSNLATLQFGGPMPASGSSSLSFNLPANMAFFGLDLGFQSVVLDAISGLPTWTCATDGKIKE